MSKYFASLPISRRLLLAFSLAVLIPDGIILWISISSIQTLSAHGVTQAQTSGLLLGAIIAILISTGLVIAIGFLMSLTISQPLRNLVALTRRIGKGETSARAIIVNRDEISIVASSMNSMLDSIVRLISETQAQRDTLQGRIEKLVNEVGGVGEGDLRIQAEVTHDALGVLADSFNYMVEELSNLVIQVKTVAQKVEVSTLNTYNSMAQLVTTAEKEIQQFTVAASGVETIATASRQVAEHAQMLDDASREAYLSAQQGRGTVQQTIEGMNYILKNVQTTAGNVQTLGERSLEIDEIVEAISSIAHQTNRLALDAAIQAAMAGENGKGFGAVATDIRRLAEQTKEQTSKVTQIVRTVREDIGTVASSMSETERETSSGAVLVQATGVTLSKIFELVEKQARDIQRINQRVQQLLHSSNDVVQIMYDISITTAQSSQSTRTVAQDMENMAKLAEQLHASVAAFKLKDDTSVFN